MENRWSQEQADIFITKYAHHWGEDLALRTYSSRLLGSDPALVLHGGGNTSVKGEFANLLGKRVPAIFVKASGWNLATISPEGLPGMALEILKQVRSLPAMDDRTMVNVLRTNLFDADAATPSIEALLHVFLVPKFIDHTHADAILTLTNQKDGERIVKDALGEYIIVLPYVHPGFALAKAAAEAFAAAPESDGMVLMHHGLITWGETAEASYAATIRLVSKAEKYISEKSVHVVSDRRVTLQSKAKERYWDMAPRLRGALAFESGDPDQPYQRFVLRPLITREVLNLIDDPKGRERLVTPPLTADHLIRTKAHPLWIDDPNLIDAAVKSYRQRYETYFKQFADQKKPPTRFDSSPRVVFMPGIGVVCVGKDVVEADLVREITAQTIAVKGTIAEMGTYQGLNEKELFAMEYYTLQLAKLNRAPPLPLERTVALITGAAGAIGSGICRELLENGCHVAASDLPGDSLSDLVSELAGGYGDRTLAVPMDVTDAKAVAGGFQQVVAAWGGVDLVISNAGLAHVSSLAEMKPPMFQKLQRVNVEGTLYLLSEAARHFEMQGTGGDVVLISTKNVFAPGAKFAAYSATKAAAHQLARIASLELAPLGVRVNMVAPDGVFSDQGRPSGLWAEVGPERMRARGLDAAELESYYQHRNLLKARITARHVAKAVLYFATRQTPTTGATLPVDGGLPDATPR